jgi:outer membrane protein W
LEKGSWIGGVNGNLSIAGRSSGTQYLSWSFNPYAMYLVSKNFAVGVDMDNGFTYYKGNYQDGSESYSMHGTTYSLQLTPTVRKYFGNGSVRPYVGLSTGVLMEHMRGYSSYDEHTTTETGFSYYLAPQVGVSWWVNDKVFLDMKASYNLMDSYFGSGYHTFDLKIGVGFKIGK